MRKMASIKRVADRYLSKGKMVRTAGEVRFVKDNSNDASSWAWKQGPSERNMQPDYNYNPKKKKELAKVLRSTTAAMGHAMSAYSTFTKIKSADVSPDGNLGGKGYIQKIMDMRKQYMNVVEALSALSDTIYDEISAPHWAAISRQETPEEKEEVAQIIQDAQDIKENPEEWAEEQEIEMDDQHDQGLLSKKTASWDRVSDIHNNIFDQWANELKEWLHPSVQTKFNTYGWEVVDFRPKLGRIVLTRESAERYHSLRGAFKNQVWVFSIDGQPLRAKDFDLEKALKDATKEAELHLKAWEHKLAQKIVDRYLRGEKK